MCRKNDKEFVSSTKDRVLEGLYVTKTNLSTRSFTHIPNEGNSRATTMLLRCIHFVGEWKSLSRQIYFTSGDKGEGRIDFEG